MSVEDVRAAILGGASREELAGIPLPGTFRAAVVREEEAARWRDVPVAERDPALAIAVEEVALPVLAADEVYLAVMASALNYTTVWSAIAHPVPTFSFLRRLGPPHDQPYHVLGSDAAGVVLRAGAAVRRWRPGDRVVVNPAQIDPEDPGAPDSHRVWGYETNYGGLAEVTVAKASQLLAKPAHLTWEEAASVTLCASTSYRMVVSENAGAMKQGDVVLVWGATGGVGGFAVQHVLAGGGVPVAVVSSPARAELVRALGCHAVIDRRAEGYRFWKEDGTQDEAEWRRFGAKIRELVGRDPDLVIEHPGRETMGASIFVARRGGTVVTCAATSGYLLEIDNRHLWMRRKRLIGSSLADPWEASGSNDLVGSGTVQPTLSRVYPLDRTGEAASDMRDNRHVGKLGVLCLAPEEGGGVDDPELRARVGEDRITRFRRAGDAG